MTAEKLYQLTAPLFAKHPSACPPRFYCQQGNYRSGFFGWRDRDDSTGFGLCDEDSDIASLIIQGHLVEWLANKSNGLTIRAVYDDPMHWTANQGHQRDSILKALIFACLEVDE